MLERVGIFLKLIENGFRQGINRYKNRKITLERIIVGSRKQFENTFLHVNF